MSDASKAGSVEIVYDILVPYILVHIACLGVFWVGVTGEALILCAVCFVVRMFGLSVGYHRYFAHRSFTTWRPVQFVLALLGALSMQRGPLWWAYTHRLHHRHADEPEDIHSPHYQGFIYSHSGWFADRRYRDTDLGKVADLAKFPELLFLDRWYPIVVLLYGVGIWWFFGAVGLVWGVFINAVLLWHVTHWIQSFSHSVGGYRRWPSKDQSRNHFLVGLITLGEWHNNHHYYPSAARQGFAWWEIDIGYYIIKVMHYFGIVKSIKPQPPKATKVPKAANAQS